MKNPARSVSEWLNHCDEQGNPGPGRTRTDVEFYTALLTIFPILWAVFLTVALMTSRP